ncbi:hypothetical protein MUDAN_BIHEEGNE_03513 [Lactiplantibacillus mudanjiangensis]|nr:hypothetical protein MUDAN_BIHEEGNE_03513 [Lactiplantibacillus mudanjiangensis]
MSGGTVGLQNVSWGRGEGDRKAENKKKKRRKKREEKKKERKATWMPDRTEANPNELNQDDARYGFRCCHLKNIWTAPLPPETELSRQMTTSTTSIDSKRRQAA